MEQIVKTYPANSWVSPEELKLSIEMEIVKGWRVVSVSFRPENHSSGPVMFVVYEKEEKKNKINNEKLK